MSEPLHSPETPRDPSANPHDPPLPRQRLAASIARILLGAGAGLVLVPPVIAQGSDPSAATTAAGPLEEITVVDRQRDARRIDSSALSKLTESLRNTPQSVAEISRELIDDRNLTSLNDALRTVPGITLGAGEFRWQGNDPAIRGFSARDDMYLDGLRDFGSYPRDPFNLEAVEVLLGPSSILFGRGSTGGAINQVSKQPRASNLTDLSFNVGNDDTTRATVDLERPVPLLGDAGAFRLNALAHKGQVADRDGARTERFGLAPSLLLDLDDSSRLTLSYFRQNSDDRPDYGLPWLDGAPAPVARSNFYGFDSDFLTTVASVGTAAFTRAFVNNLSFDATVRYARYARKSRITEPLITPAPAPGMPLGDIDVYRHVFLGESTETMAAGQAEVRYELDGRFLDHTIVAGVEVSGEGSNPVFAFGSGAVGTNLVVPTPSDVFAPTTTVPRVRSDTYARTVGAYAIDTLKLRDHWQVTLGVRWDRFDTNYEAERFTGPPTPFNAGDVAGHESFGQVDRASSYRAAFVYKTSARTSFYLAGSTSFNPSGQGLSFLTTGRALGTGNEYLDPEQNLSVEVGMKTGLRGDALSVSGAVFEIDKTNARVPDPSNPGFNTLGGEQRMRGLSAEIAGLVTDALYLSAGYAYLDGEVVRSAPGAVAGARLANAPKQSASLWADYRATEAFDFGFGIRYVGSQLAHSTGQLKSVPSYTLIDAMARYRFSDALTVKLNLANLTDEYYFDQLHPWHVIPGAGFTATLAVNLSY